MPPAASIAKLDDHAIEVVTICQDVDRVLHILSVIGYLVFGIWYLVFLSPVRSEKRLSAFGGNKISKKLNL